MVDSNFLFKSECYKIIGCCIDVHSNLGCGFLEAVYQEALELELIRNLIPYELESQIDIHYKGVVLDKKYYADFICYDEIILELKAVKSIEDMHVAQLMNYLKATGKKVGYLINLGARSLEYKRIVL
ncbi:GxxExxY protein [Ancylomarina sp. DW003]|nr:GxxExxY protein [Ancylomarina sp. DW003]MDE5421924.1 GxxExxY protein [Ancylomarina sp. DW003]